MRVLEFLILLFMGCLMLPAQAEMLAGRVVRVEDGMRLQIEDGDKKIHHVKLLGTDAPDKRQAFGNQSQTALTMISVHQQAQADCRRYDQNGILCVVKINGRDIGLEQIKAGMAWWSPDHFNNQTPQERTAYQQAEFQAKIHRYGLWQGQNPTPPWEWRSKNAR